MHECTRSDQIFRGSAEDALAGRAGIQNDTLWAEHSHQIGGLRQQSKVEVLIRRTSCRGRHSVSTSQKGVAGAQLLKPELLVWASGARAVALVPRIHRRTYGRDTLLMIARACATHVAANLPLPGA